MASSARRQRTINTGKTTGARTVALTGSPMTPVASGVPPACASSTTETRQLRPAMRDGQRGNAFDHDGPCSCAASRLPSSAVGERYWQCDHEDLRRNGPAEGIAGEPSLASITVSAPPSPLQWSRLTSLPLSTSARRGHGWTGVFYFGGSQRLGLLPFSPVPPWRKRPPVKPPASSFPMRPAALSIC